MLDSPPIPDELWAKVPPDAQAAIAIAFLAMRQRVDELETRVRDLEARLRLDSTNSSKPPSSDPIGMKRKPPAPPSGKKRGGQPGHRKAHRALVPPEKVRETFHCKPSTCRRCGGGLAGDDPEPLIHQVAELPKIEPIVDEYRLHRLACPDCGETTCGILPPGVPSGCFGPYLQAVLAMFAVAYRLSKRQIQQLASDVFALSISTGMISKLERQSAAALEAPYNELAASVHEADVVNIDETSWRENRRKAWLWATVTGFFTVFTIAKNRSGKIAKALLGSKDDQVVGSDRFSAYEWIKAFWRQVCWAHLRRKLFDIAKGGNAPIATEALVRIAALYEIEATFRGSSADHRRAQRQVRSAPLVHAFRSFLEQQLARVSAKPDIAEALRYALNHWDGLARFLDDGRVELDTNIVERSMRPQALTRKNSLFAGHDDGADNWAIIASLIETAKLNGIDPQRWLADVLIRLFNRWPNEHLDELMPWAWRADQHQADLAA